MYIRLVIWYTQIPVVIRISDGWVKGSRVKKKNIRRLQMKTATRKFNDSDILYKGSSTLTVYSLLEWI